MPLRVNQSSEASLPGMRTAKLLESEDEGYAEAPKMETPVGLRGVKLVETDDEWALRIWTNAPVLGLKAFGDDEMPDVDFTHFLFLNFNNPILVGEAGLTLPERDTAEPTGTHFAIEAREFAEEDESQEGYFCEWQRLGFYRCPEHLFFKKTRTQYRAGEKTCKVILYYTCPEHGGEYEEPGNCPYYPYNELEPVYHELALEYYKTATERIRSWGLRQSGCETAKYDPQTGILLKPRYGIRAGYEGSLATYVSSEWHEFYGCDEHENVFIHPDDYEEGMTCPVGGGSLVLKKMRWLFEVEQNNVWPWQTIALEAGVGQSAEPITYSCVEEEGEEITYSVPNILDKTTRFPTVKAEMEIQNV